jgi:aminodeoxyfutalosine deaminase
LPWPAGGVPTEPDALRRFYAFTSFPHFLDVYAQVNLLVRTGADVVTLLDGLAAQLAESKVRYAEVQVTPVRNRMAGIGFDELAQALVDGRTMARERHSVELGWIFDADAALGPPSAAETVAFAAGHRPRGNGRSRSRRPRDRPAPCRLRSRVSCRPRCRAAQSAARRRDSRSR